MFTDQHYYSQSAHLLSNKLSLPFDDQLPFIHSPPITHSSVTMTVVQTPYHVVFVQKLPDTGLSNLSTWTGAYILNLVLYSCSIARILPFLLHSSVKDTTQNFS